MERERFLSSIYLIIKNGEGKVLLQRRQGTNLWPGFLALPAGHIDKGENTYEAAIREAKEELGIDISQNDIIDTFVSENTASGNGGGLYTNYISGTINVEFVLKIFVT